MTDHTAPLATASAALLFAAAALLAAPARADDSTAQVNLPDTSTMLADAGNAGTSGTTNPDDGPGSPLHQYFANWFTRVDKAQGEQPHWMTPIVTVTPRLEEELRWDQYWQTNAKGAGIVNYDAGKGLELIPFETVEFILQYPPYIQSTVLGHKTVEGFGDWPFFLYKQRLLTANEENGNYILTFFLSGQAPAGIKPFSTNAYYVTPTIAGGMGWGDFDFQATMGLAYPINNAAVVGKQLVTNVALQYHVLQYIWPEFELNDTLWLDGNQRGGKNQLFAMPGVIFGRFPLFWRFKVNIGVGYQTALTKQTYETALTPLYNHAWIMTARIPF